MGYDPHQYTMVHDQGMQEMAAERADALIKLLRQATSAQNGKKAGFNDQTMIAAARIWAEIGQFAKGSNYWALLRGVWVLTYAAPPMATKLSLALIDRLVQLEHSLSRGGDGKDRFDKFHAAEGLMRALVYEYRMRIRAQGPLRLAEFDRTMRETMEAVNPDFGLSRGH
jgi:hypothetical protein